MIQNRWYKSRKGVHVDNTQTYKMIWEQQQCRKVKLSTTSKQTGWQSQKGPSSHGKGWCCKFSVGESSKDWNCSPRWVKEEVYSQGPRVQEARPTLSLKQRICSIDMSSNVKLASHQASNLTLPVKADVSLKNQQFGFFALQSDSGLSCAQNSLSPFLTLPLCTVNLSVSLIVPVFLQFPSQQNVFLSNKDTKWSGRWPKAFQQGRNAGLFLTTYLPTD